MILSHLLNLPNLVKLVCVQSEEIEENSMAEGGEGSTSVYGFVPGSDADYVSVPECLRVSVTVLVALGRHGCFQVALRPSTPIRLLN